MTEEHSSPIKNWKQLLAVVVLAFVVPITLILIVTQLVTGRMRDTTAEEASVLARIKPVGEVVLAEASQGGQQTGEQVYNAVCKTCHEGGLAGAPKFGDKAAWAPRIAHGEKLALTHALQGYNAMPAKGGNPNLSDDEVHRAVAYMAKAAGADWKEPPVGTATAQAGGGDRSGQQVVEAVCARCHATGVNGAPKIGDQAAWRQRASRGFQTVAQSALRGHAGMPARGGMAELSDVEVKRAIEYMFAATSPVAAASTAAAPSAATAPAATVPTTAAAAPSTATAAAQPDGKKVYDTVCMACHASGVAGAPKYGDKAAWGPRIKQGQATLYNSALHGKGAMPAKGGNPSLSDADVKAGVDYMVAAGK